MIRLQQIVEASNCFRQNSFIKFLIKTFLALVKLQGFFLYQPLIDAGVLHL